MHEKIRSVGIVAHKSLVERIAKFFLDSESFEVIPVGTALGVDLQSFDENPYEDFLRAVHSLYAEVGKVPRPKVDRVELPVVFDEEEFESFTSALKREMEKIDRKIKELEEKMNDLGRTILALEILRGIDAKVEDITSTRWVGIKVGKLPDEYYERFVKSVSSENVIVLRRFKRGEDVFVLIIHPKSEEGDIEEALKNAAFEELKLEGICGGIEEALFEMKDERKALEIKLQELRLEKKEIFYRNRRKIYELYDVVFVLKSVHDLLKNFGSSREFVVITGWITEKGLNELRKFAKDMEGVVVFEDIKVSVEKPTLLRNNAFFKHFEFLVRMYGIPRSDEIDPTPIIASLFLFFYGFMFGDVGHGGVIALLAWLIYRRTRQDLWFVMSFAGISSLVFGFLYGSIFGFETIPPLFKRPLENINDFLIISIVIGMILIIFGMVLNVLNRLMRREIVKLIFDPNGFAGLGLYLTASSAFIYYLMNGSLPMSIGGLLILIGIFTALIFLNVVLFEEGNFGERLTLAFFETFDRLLAFFSNTLSFIRLGAFAMNHAGLFLAFYTMAKMSHSAFGSFMSLMLGNLLLIFLEGLVVFIQSVRLEFYEFFSKFYSGDGREFKPVTYERGGAEG